MRNGAPKDALPGARYRDKLHETVEWGRNRGHTLPMDPQQGTGGLPLFEKAALEEPVGGSLVLSAAQDNVVCGWIGR